MIRKSVMIGCIFLFFMNLIGSEKIGHILLDRMAVTLNEMNESDTPEKREKIQKSLNEMMRDAREAKDKGQIDATFIERYRRLLSLQKLIFADDPEGIFISLIEKEITEFLKDVKGENFSSGKRGDFFKDFIETMAEEISRLRDYLNKNNWFEKFQTSQKFSETFL